MSPVDSHFPRCESRTDRHRQLNDEIDSRAENFKLFASQITSRRSHKQTVITRTCKQYQDRRGEKLPVPRPEQNPPFLPVPDDDDKPAPVPEGVARVRADLPPGRVAQQLIPEEPRVGRVDLLGARADAWVELCRVFAARWDGHRKVERGLDRAAGGGGLCGGKGEGVLWLVG